MLFMRHSVADDVNVVLEWVLEFGSVDRELGAASVFTGHAPLFVDSKTWFYSQISSNIKQI